MDAPFRPIKDTITYDDLQKVDIRVGRIVVAMPVPKTKKLLQLQVDFGPVIGTKQVVSGIAEHFDPEILKDTYHPFVLNLEPREIRGILSEAMIVASEGPTGSLFQLKCAPIPGSLVL